MRLIMIGLSVLVCLACRTPQTGGAQPITAPTAGEIASDSFHLDRRIGKYEQYRNGVKVPYPGGKAIPCMVVHRPGKKQLEFCLRDVPADCDKWMATDRRSYFSYAGKVTRSEGINSKTNENEVVYENRFQLPKNMQPYVHMNCLDKKNNQLDATEVYTQIVIRNGSATLTARYKCNDVFHVVQGTCSLN